MNDKPYWYINPTSEIVIEKNGWLISRVGSVGNSKTWFDLYFAGLFICGSLDLIELMRKI